MKKIIKVVLLIILIIIIYIIAVSFINNKNKNYIDNISQNILDNYNIDKKITYSNIYGNYYIITTKDKVIVLNKEYEEILVKDIDTLASNHNNYALIYKNNKLMYEETILKENKLIYKYYDATNNKIIKETSMEKK